MSKLWSMIIKGLFPGYTSNWQLQQTLKDATTDRDRLSRHCADLTQENERVTLQRDEYLDSLADDDHLIQELYEQQMAYSESVRKLKDALMAAAHIMRSQGLSCEVIYNTLIPGWDVQGWNRYDVAKTMIRNNVGTHFYAEEAMGKFEDMNGHELLYWLELTKYGDVESDLQGSYEFVVSHQIHDDDQYRSYRNELHERVVDAMLHGQEKGKRQALPKETKEAVH